MRILHLENILIAAINVMSNLFITVFTLLSEQIIPVRQKINYGWLSQQKFIRRLQEKYMHEYK